jgi:flagellar L-ring protein FlgH
VKRLLGSLLVCALAQACAVAPQTDDVTSEGDFSAVYPEAAFGVPTAGTIYNAAATFDLFMDLRARQVGDILTVLLVERTDASKESSASAAKDSSVDTGMPIFGGQIPTHNGNPILNNEFDGSRSFDGSADASQSNRLDGSISVTVAGRMPNGNLLVRGEKRITINQGAEFIRLEGIVRPVDIGPENTVPSTKVGDARISYSGRGTLDDSNRPGWVWRFFNSPWFPF